MLSTTARRTRNMDIIQESFIVHIQSRCLFIPRFMSHTFSSPFRPSQSFSLPLIMHAFIFSYSGSSSTPRVNYPFPKEFQTTSSLSHTQCSIATHLNLLAFTEVVNVDVWVLWRCTACILRVAQAAMTMNLAVAVPCLISVGADLTARIWLFGALGNANTFGCVAVNVADTTSAAVNVGAGIVWRRRIVQLRTMTGEIFMDTHKSSWPTTRPLLSSCISRSILQPLFGLARFHASNLRSGKFCGILISSCLNT